MDFEQYKTSAYKTKNGYSVYNVEGTDYSINRAKIVKMFGKYYKMECPNCKGQMKVTSFEVEHIEPRFMGGALTVNNVTFLCGSCHNVKSDYENKYMFNNIEYKRIQKNESKKSPFRKAFDLMTSYLSHISAKLLKHPQYALRMVLERIIEELKITVEVFKALCGCFNNRFTLRKSAKEQIMAKYF